MRTHLALVSQIVASDQQQLDISSHDIAREFSKRHSNVLRAIDNLGCSPKFRAESYEQIETTTENASGLVKTQREYRMTRDGATMLLFGFTGKAAAAFKEDYIREFNRKEHQLATGARWTTSADMRSLAELESLFVRLRNQEG